MENKTNNFYDAVAEYYPYLFRDWDMQLEREELGLRAMFRDQNIQRVLDASCGPGTQTVPMAKLGLDVVAVDPSAGMIRKAKETAQRYGVSDSITFRLTDFLSIPERVDGTFDAIVCKGNSLPHLITDAEIERTIKQFHALLRPDGLLVIGLRDFEFLMEHRPEFLPGVKHEQDDGSEFITFETWEWNDGPPVIATRNLYIVQGNGRDYETQKESVTFRPLSTDEVKVVLLEQNFGDIQHQSDREDILIAKRK